MFEPFAACNGGPETPDCLSIGVAGTTETWAPVSTRKRRSEIESYTNSWVLRGPTAVEFTVGPAARFPGS